MMKMLICVFLGSGIGGTARYGLSVLINRMVGDQYDKLSFIGLFPWATLAVNVIGCFLIGLIYGAVDSGAISISNTAKVFLTAGICGGLTTFSTFTHENYLLFQSSSFGVLLVYVAVSIVAGFGAAWGGHAVLH